ncbi:hypothetical protein ACFQZC_31700 [Streptacidiphilus monticola]
MLLLAAFLLAALALTALPETAVRRPGAARSLLPRARVPRQARRAFTALVPGMIANWAVGGLYLSLVPSLVARVLHVGNHLVGGLAIATLCAAATVSSYAMRGRAARPQLVLGSAALAVGMLGTLAALELDSLALLFVTTAVAGVGFGVAFLGTLSTLGPLAAAGSGRSCSRPSTSSTTWPSACPRSSPASPSRMQACCAPLWCTAAWWPRSRWPRWWRPC